MSETVPANSKSTPARARSTRSRVKPTSARAKSSPTGAKSSPTGAKSTRARSRSAPTSETLPARCEPLPVCSESLPARDDALRLLAEGQRADFALLADATGLSVKWLMQKAEREGWKPSRPSAEDVEARVRTIIVAALGQLEELARAAAKKGGRIEKAEIDAVITLIKGAGSIGDIMRPEPAAKENQIARDEELATVLERINGRIVELARALAAQMVAGERRGAGRLESH